MRVGESGKTIRLKLGYDANANTELTITFTLPDNSTVTKTKTGGEVTLGTVTVTDDDLGVLAANEYVEYETEVGFLSQSGTWCAYVTYDNTNATPADKFISDPDTFTVDPLGC